MVVATRGGAHKLSRESGQGLVEYALILALVALVTLAALALVGGQLVTFFTDLVNFLQSL